VLPDTTSLLHVLARDTKDSRTQTMYTESTYAMLYTAHSSLCLLDSL
jgi:hypothetical protein